LYSTYVLISLETILLVLLLLDKKRVISFSCASLALGLVTISPVRQLAEANPLNCGCGLSAGFLSPRAQQLLSVATNFMLIASMVLSWPDGQASKQTFSKGESNENEAS